MSGYNEAHGPTAGVILDISATSAAYAAVLDVLRGAEAGMGRAYAACICVAQLRDRGLAAAWGMSEIESADLAAVDWVAVADAFDDDVEGDQLNEDDRLDEDDQLDAAPRLMGRTATGVAVHHRPTAAANPGRVADLTVCNRHVKAAEDAACVVIGPVFEPVRCPLCTAHVPYDAAEGEVAR